MKLMTIRCLLLVYGLAIIHAGAIDIGHSFLHTIKSKLHGHAHGHHHSIRDHQPSININAEGENESDEAYAFGACFLYFENVRQITPLHASIGRHDLFHFEADTHRGYQIPTTPPPLS